MIRHTVVFNLKHPAGSPKEQAFLKDAQILSAVPSVRKFERLRQVSPKNDYSFGFSMEFDDQSGYDAYDINPDHVHFVQKRWLQEVSDFLEIDYAPL